jgi:septum formation protein
MRNKVKAGATGSGSLFPLIVLASASPRRAELLKNAQLDVVIRKPEIDERARPREQPEELVRRLCQEKAQVIAKDLQNSDSAGVILAADTIVISPRGGSVLGKPADPRQAERMLRLLSGNTHTVLTGYCLLGFGLSSEAGKVVRRVVKSRVTMKSLSAELIHGYVRTGEPMDKAGAYAAQGFGMCFIEKISGSYTNVVGLPIAQVLDDLEAEFGIRPRF